MEQAPTWPGQERGERRQMRKATGRHARVLAGVVLVAQVLGGRGPLARPAVAAGPPVVRRGGGVVQGGGPLSGLRPVTGRPGSALVGTVPIVGSDVAVDARTDRAFIMGGGGTGPGFVATLDARSGRLLRRVAVGTLPVAIAVDQTTSRVFVACATDQSVSVLDGRSGRLIQTVSVLGQPTSIAVDEPTNRVFVASRVDSGGPGYLSVLDARSGHLVRTVGSGPEPTAVAVDAATARVFVTIGGTNSVTVLDARQARFVRDVPVGTNPLHVVVDPSTAHVFVVTNGDNSVSMLDAATGVHVRTVAGLGLAAEFVAVDPRTGRIFVTSGGTGSDGSVSVLDARSGALLRTVRVGDGPAEVVVSGETRRAFVLGKYDVRMLDVQTGAVVRTLLDVSSPFGAAVDAARQQIIVLNAFTTDPSAEILDARTGALRRSTNLDPTAQGLYPIYNPLVDAARSRVYVLISSPLARDNILGGPGRLDILDATTGALRRSITLPDTVDPGGGSPFKFDVLVLDASTHRLFVLSDTLVTVFDTAHL